MSSLAFPPFSTTSSSRLQSLYSDISRQKHSNPAAFQANIDWWRNALSRFLSESNNDNPKLVLNVDRSLIDSLRIPAAGKPLALGSVINELQLPSDSNTPSLLPLAAFISSAQSIFDPGSLPLRVVSFVVGKPLWWALSQLGIVGQESASTRVNARGGPEEWWGQYVFFELLDSAADRVIQTQATVGEPDALYDWLSFRRIFAPNVHPKHPNEIMHETDAKVLVRYLERDRAVLVSDNEVIKFFTDDASSREITSVDRGIVELRVAVAKLHAQVEAIQAKIDATTVKASAALKASHKSLALTHLRTRKSFESVLARRLQSLEILQGTLTSVENARSDVEILALHASSTSTLRALLAHPSLQRDAIDATMEALAEANGAAKDIDETIRIGVDIALDIPGGEEDLEEELNRLTQEAEAEKLQAKLGIPGQVPVHIGDVDPPLDITQREAVPAS